MNAKRRAELQRKLTLNAVPRPPAGLAERIKADIPQYLEPDTTPARISRAIPFNMRIAASVMVLFTSVIVAMMVVRQRGAEQKVADAGAGRVVIFPPASRAVATTDTTATMNVVRTEEVNLDIVEEAPAMPQLAVGRVAPPTVRRDEEADDARRQNSVEGEVATGVGTESRLFIDDDVTETRVAPAQPQMAGASRQSIDSPAAPPPAAPVPAPAPVAQSIIVTAEAPMVERRERAAAPAYAPEPAAGARALAKTESAEKKKDSVFGISVDAQVFDQIRATLESGHRPNASAVNIEALVNYFAGEPAKRPRHGMRLEVEASPAAIPAEGDHAVLRFSIDTPDGAGIAASDARVEVILSDAAVAHAHRIGDNDALARESTLSYGTSVTGLYALELKPGLRASQVVATVRLTYLAGGKPERITKQVLAKDLTKSWQRASRRHRLASLGALWGESLKTTSGGVDVARRAEELATQEPDDVRARELARAASASAAGGR